jgi:Gpi18-like mannosyltransferase
LTIFLTMRLALSLLAALVLWLLNPPTAPDPVVRPYQGVAPILGGWAELVFGVWQRFDTLWYLKIATHGYSLEDGSTVYFPLYPLLIRLLGKAFLGNYLLAALVISNLAYIGLLFYLYRLTTLLFEEETAQRTVVYWAIFPTAFFFLAGYTESLFLLFTLAAFCYAHQKRWWLAGFLGFLASLTRLQGVILILPLLYFYFKSERRVRPALLALFLIPLGAASFLFYLNSLGASLFDVYQSHLHAQFVLPWDNIIATVQKILSPEGTFIDIVNLIMTFIFLAMTITSFRAMPLTYSLYMALTIFVLLLRRTTAQPLVSMSRYVLTLFPAFIIWGLRGKNPWVNRLIVYPSIALLIYLCGQFAIWGWVA